MENRGEKMANELVEKLENVTRDQPLVEFYRDLKTVIDTLEDRMMIAQDELSGDELAEFYPGAA